MQRTLLQVALPGAPHEKENYPRFWHKQQLSVQLVTWHVGKWYAGSMRYTVR